MLYIFLAEGFEEMEALFPVDILRRGGVDVQTVGVTGKTVTGSHGISVTADITLAEATTEHLVGVVLPGGLPGTTNLEASLEVQAFLDYANENGLLIAAICAAPSVLGKKKLLEGKCAVCYPGFEEHLSGATVLDQSVVRDGNVITARGAGAAADFGFALLTYFTETIEAETKLRAGMCFE